MSNVVHEAITYAASKGIGDANSIWHVTFAGGETRSGIIFELNDNLYVLAGARQYYFSADMVMFLNMDE